MHFETLEIYIAMEGCQTVEGVWFNVDVMLIRVFSLMVHCIANVACQSCATKVDTTNQLTCYHSCLPVKLPNSISLKKFPFQFQKT